MVPRICLRLPPRIAYPEIREKQRETWMIGTRMLKSQKMFINKSGFRHIQKVLLFGVLFSRAYAKKSANLKQQLVK